MHFPSVHLATLTLSIFFRPETNKATIHFFFMLFTQISVLFDVNINTYTLFYSILPIVQVLVRVRALMMASKRDTARAMRPTNIKVVLQRVHLLA
jgi:hypothetical protein